MKVGDQVIVIKPSGRLLLDSIHTITEISISKITGMKFCKLDDDDFSGEGGWWLDHFVVIDADGSPYMSCICNSEVEWCDECLFCIEDAYP